MKIKTSKENLVTGIVAAHISLNISAPSSLINKLSYMIGASLFSAKNETIFELYTCLNDVSEVYSMDSNSK